MNHDLIIERLSHNPSVVKSIVHGVTAGQARWKPSGKEWSILEIVSKVLRPYMIIVAIDGKIGNFGGVTYKPEPTIRNSIQVIDNQGNSYRPLSNEEIDADTKNFLSMMQPVLANMLGPMGQNMHFYLFPPKNKAGQDIASAKKEGAFSLILDKRQFNWRLPLGSLLAPKICPVDGEKLSGAWKFCPWHGAELK
jgi:hypothetical protein